ncbi:MAG: endonuclease VIII, partial [Gammaproteobacteria bacterium]|nr:endonuclease VIII [Gammaproteobacteria bacterium]
LGTDQLVARLQQSRFNRRQLGSLLLDQPFLAGLGNYLRCEILFAAGLHPTKTALNCNAEQLQLLAETTLQLPLQSYQTGGITNQLEQAHQLQRQGATFEESRFLVFRRQGKPCYNCGTMIRKTAAHGRPCYTCPGCQRG